MTKVEYEQWCDFALRMATVCYAENNRPSGEEILENVKDYLERWQRGYAQIVDWDRSDDDDHVCDDFDSWRSDFYPGFYWRLRDEVAQKMGDDADYWEVEQRAREREDFAREQWEQQWFGPVACCVRAGLDMATRPGGGVVGFSVADLRAMYPERIPNFVSRHYEDDLNALDADVGVWL